jgi:hypothetical protein
MDFDGWASDPARKVREFADDQEFRKAADQAVLLAASQYPHEEVKQIVDGVERQVCSQFGGVSCTATRRIKGEVFLDFAVEGEIISPLFLVARPDKTIVARLEHEHEPADVIRALEKAFRALGPGMPRADYRRMTQGLEELERRISQQDYGLAVEISSGLLEIPGDFPPHERLRAARKRLEEAGANRAAAAVELWDKGAHFDALKRMDAVEAAFGRMGPGRQAKSQLARWLKTAEGKPLKKEFGDYQKARRLYDEGMRLDRKGELRKALSKLKQLVKRYPDSIFAQRAESTIAVIEDELGRGPEEEAR